MLSLLLECERSFQESLAHGTVATKDYLSDNLTHPSGTSRCH